MVEKWVCGKTKFLIRSLVVQWKNQSFLDACITVIRPWPSQALLSFCPITLHSIVSFLIFFLPNYNYTLRFFLQKFIPFRKKWIENSINFLTNIFIIKRYYYILCNDFELLNTISISNEIFRDVFIR